MVSPKYSHHEEVSERLSFLQLFAANSGVEISKVELKVIYDLLASSPVRSDLEEFFQWCKSACENLSDRVVDLNEVGEFFSEQVAQRVLNLKLMPVAGFHFIQMFFVSSNIDANHILKEPRPKKSKKNQSGLNLRNSTLWRKGNRFSGKRDE